MKIKNKESKVPIISILGCGWLGLPLAMQLIDLGYNVKGSTTTSSKCSKLKEYGIDAYKIVATPNSVEGDIEGLFRDSNILIINIPPNLRLNEGEDYLKLLKKLYRKINSSSITKILYVSSTSVYRGGPDFPIASENSESLAKNDKAKILIKAEGLFALNSRFLTTVIRFSGLIGDERHPAKYLSGRENIKDPDAPVNLIHLEDCIAIIIKVIATNTWGETMNASYPQTPSRIAYYTSKCSGLGLPPPVFDHSKISEGKMVSSEKLMSTLDYKFKSPIY